MPLPDDVDPRELDYDVRKQLMTLAKDTADLVARHLIVAGRLMDDDPVQALAHARAARALAGRVGAVRESNGLVAYLAGEWQEALSELRTARRLTGDPEHLPIMADCERALGRPDRALLVAGDPQAKSLSPAARVELLIVASGARRDQGQAEAAVVSLQVGALEGPVRAWTARLRYAYADALLDAGREDDAREWFARAAEVDERGETDADERILELDGMVLEDLDTDGHEGDRDGGEEPEAPVDLDSLVRVAAAVTAARAHVVSGPDEVRAGEPDVAEVASATAEAEPAEAEPAEAEPAEAEPAEAEPAEAEVVSVDAEVEATEPEVEAVWQQTSNAPFREVPDSEIPALGKAGTTGLGFVAPPPTSGDQREAEAEDDELRLFD